MKFKPGKFYKITRGVGTMRNGSIVKCCWHRNKANLMLVLIHGDGDPCACIADGIRADEIQINASTDPSLDDSMRECNSECYPVCTTLCTVNGNVSILFNNWWSVQLCPTESQITSTCGNDTIKKLIL